MTELERLRQQNELKSEKIINYELKNEMMKGLLQDKRK